MVDRKHPRPGTLAARAAATQRVIDRYRDKPFSWNGANCIRLAAGQARAMGHKVPPVPLFRSALGAKKALVKAGAADITALLDQHFMRLPSPAFALVGDLVILPGEPETGFEAVCVADGQGNLFGWHDAAAGGLTVIKFAAADALGAWRL